MLIFNFFISLLKATLLVLIFTVVLSIAVGGMSDWILMDQISMADNFKKNGSFYSNITSQMPSGVSSYFPGNALIATIFLEFGIHTYLPEMMTVVSILVFFVFVLIQKIIVKQIFYIDVNSFNCFLIVVIISFALCPHWLDYTLRFKPDMIALVLGFTGLCLTNFVDPKTNILRLAIGALIFSLGLIFKQQYLAFIIGMIFYSIFNFYKSNTIFTIFTLCFSSCILLTILQNEKAWFWHILTYSDDPFYSFDEFFAIQSFTIMFYSIVVIVILIAKFSNRINLPNQEYFSSGAFRKNPLFWLCLPTLVFCFLGALKRGGDEGNLELFIILISPFFILLLAKIDRKYLITIAYLVTFFQVSKIPLAFSSYQQANDLRTFVETLDITDEKLILTGSNTYFASRTLIKTNKIINFWTAALMDHENALPEQKLKDILEETLFDVLVVQNNEKIERLIGTSDKYEIVFKNKKGQVAILKKDIHGY